MTAPAGLTYLNEYDVLLVKFFDGENMPCDLTTERVRDRESGVTFDVWTDANGHIHMITVHNASKAVPKAVFKNAPGRPLAIIEASDEPGTWLVPFFPEAGVVGRRAIGYSDGNGPANLEALIATSGRLVGFQLRDAPRNLGHGLEADT